MYAVALFIVVGTFAGARGARVETVRIPFEGIAGRGYTTVVLPDAYDTSQDRYPVVYFLHGYGGNHRSWLAHPGFTDLADTHECLLVCASPGPATWYRDSPRRSRSQAATYVAVAVVGHIDSLYRTRTSPGARVLAGSSMGGHGALMLMTDYPHLFGAAVAISAPMELVSAGNRWGLRAVFGSSRQGTRVRREHSFLYRIGELDSTTGMIRLDCGTSDWALESNRAAGMLLERHGIPHVREEHPGGHTPAYVSAALPRQMAAIAAFFRKEALEEEERAPGE